MSDDEGVVVGSVGAAIERYRDLAKYLVAIFAAVGGVLIGGTQLTALGALDWDEDRARLVLALVALVVALLAVVIVVQRAIAILRPLEMPLEDVVDSTDLRTAINARPDLLHGRADVGEIRALLEDETLRADARESWHAVARRVVEYASFLELQRRFDRACWAILASTVIGAGAVTAFAWAANPPDDSPAAVVAPAAARVQVALTPTGREALAGALGARCVMHPVAALMIGGTAQEPLVVALPRAGCAPVRFTLQRRHGVLLDGAGAGG